MSGRPKRAADSPQQPRTAPRARRGKGYYKSEVEREAIRQGMSVEEYGVYKGSVGSAVKPVNSAVGLLVLSLLISLFTGIAVAGFFILWVQDGFNAARGVLLPMLLAATFTIWSWVYFAREHRAEKLRKARGITLLRPE